MGSFNDGGHSFVLLLCDTFNVICLALDNRANSMLFAWCLDNSSKVKGKGKSTFSFNLKLQSLSMQDATILIKLCG